MSTCACQSSPTFVQACKCQIVPFYFPSLIRNHTSCWHISKSEEPLLPFKEKKRKTLHTGQNSITRRVLHALSWSSKQCVACLKEQFVYQTPHGSMNSLPPKQQCSQATLPNSNMATHLQSGNGLSSKHSVNEAVNDEAPDASKMESIQIFFSFFRCL